MMRLLTLITLGLFGLADLRAEYGGIAKEGDRAFAFAGPATNGGDFSLEACKGKVVVVYFFATDAGAGMQELKMIQKYVWPKYRSAGLILVGVARNAEPTVVAKVAKDLRIEFPLLADPNKEIFLHYASKGHPRVYLIGRDGTIKLVSLGYTDDEVARISWYIGRELAP